jgi:hypothetical protein
MYHFDNGYHAKIETLESNGTVECAIHVTGNNTDLKIVHLSMSECADCLIRIRDQRASKK